VALRRLYVFLWCVFYIFPLYETQLHYGYETEIFDDPNNVGLPQRIQYAFFLFLILFCQNMFAQNPGNVGTANLTAWFKADSLPAGDVLSWQSSYPQGPNAITFTGGHRHVKN
jgi:hypothetical protein